MTLSIREAFGKCEELINQGAPGQTVLVPVHFQIRFKESTIPTPDNPNPNCKVTEIENDVTADGYLEYSQLAFSFQFVKVGHRFVKVPIVVPATMSGVAIGVGNVAGYGTGGSGPESVSIAITSPVFLNSSHLQNLAIDASGYLNGISPIHAQVDDTTPTVEIRSSVSVAADQPYYTRSIETTVLLTIGAPQLGQMHRTVPEGVEPVRGGVLHG